MKTIEIKTLPHAPKGTFVKSGLPTDAGFDIKAAETKVILPLNLLDELGFELEPIPLSKEELEELKSDKLFEKYGDSIIFYNEAGFPCIKKRKLQLVKTGLKVRPRELMWNALVNRSSNPKYGISMPHGLGVIDFQYTDELFVSLFALYEPVLVFKGQRIAQLVPINLEDVQALEMEPDKIIEELRSGFGSTNFGINV